VISLCPYPSMKSHHPARDPKEIVLSFDVTFRLDFAIDAQGDYVATCPELPGFSGSGWNIDAARYWARMQIMDYLRQREDAGEPVPLLRYTAFGRRRPSYRA
jgi:predicted RNase H-like HicB family nuclease